MRAAVIDRSRKVLHRAKAEGAMADQLDLVIHPFERAIRNPQPSARLDAAEMSTQHPNQFVERLEPRTHARVHPGSGCA